jgi:2-polyprenyl-3-methyl-5-hydroxy-6-metoxy-1,4-benzoquinol methylase
MLDRVRTFDRTDDVSKIEGCNTRGIESRWTVFSDEIAAIPAGAEALDFGAGSLRESFDLAERGFNVTSIDLDGELLASYKSDYAWPINETRHQVIASASLTDGLAALGDKRFDLVTCFDVLEHLVDPSIILRTLRDHMKDGGKLFITVPNGRSLFEIAWRLDLKIARATGRYMRPGEPHLQRNSPHAWKQILRSSRFEVVRHEMAIGFLANTIAALVQLPLAIGGRLLRKIGINVDAIGLAQRICSGRRMELVNSLDRKTEFIFEPLYGWNLFVVLPIK